MKHIHIAGAKILLLVVIGCCQAQAQPEVVLLTWNVENLFDWRDDPDNPGDDEFTPHAWRYWSEIRYRRKLDNLAEVIAASEADFVGLQEIENRKVLEDLTAVLLEKHDREYPYIVHREGPDHRGIDVALLAVYPPVLQDWFTPVAEQRDILQATFAPYGGTLTLFINHWKSRWGGQEKTNPLRMQQAVAVRAAVETLLRADPNAAIVVMGDFNDNFDDASLVEGLRSVASIERFEKNPTAGPLLNLHAGLPAAERRTFYYRRGKVWNSLDGMHVTRAMVGTIPQPTWRVLPDTYEVLRWTKLINEWGHPKAFRRITNPDTQKRYYQYGYSDHLPVRLRLRLSGAVPDINAHKNDSFNKQLTCDHAAL